MAEIKIIMPDGTEHEVEVPDDAIDVFIGTGHADGRWLPIIRPKIKKYRWEKRFNSLISYTARSEEHYTRDEMFKKGLSLGHNHWHPVEGSEI